MKCPFVIGQKIVCIVDMAPTCFNGETAPKEGAIYTVAQFEDGGSDIGLYLEEITNVPRWYRSCATGLPCFREVSWSYTAFRPLEERKTDISIFEAMLTPAPNKKERETV